MLWPGLEQSVWIGPLGPFALRIFRLELLVGRLERLGVMSALVAAHAVKKDGFRSGIALGVLAENSLQAGDGILPLVEIEGDFRTAQQKGWNQLLGRQETDTSMVFIALPIERYQGRGPLDLKFLGKGIVVVRQPDRDHIPVDKGLHSRIWIRNRIHLLATDSAGIEEVQEHGPLLLLGSLKSSTQFRFPSYFVFHDRFLL